MKPQQVRLEEYITTHTRYSRRKVTDLLREGKIEVNKKTADSLTMLITPRQDTVAVDGRKIEFEGHYYYYKFYKPKGVITSLGDPRGRRTVMDYMQSLPPSVFPVGRLDRNTTGLLILTNDGEFAQQLSHPRFKIPKTYNVTLDAPVTKRHLERLVQGVMLDDGPAVADEVIPETPTQLTFVISEGRNRIVRRMFECLDYEVLSLKRISIGPLMLGHLKVGQIKPLNTRELRSLKSYTK